MPLETITSRYSISVLELIRNQYFVSCENVAGYAAVRRSSHDNRPSKCGAGRESRSVIVSGGTRLSGRARRHGQAGDGNPRLDEDPGGVTDCLGDEPHGIVGQDRVSKRTVEWFLASERTIASLNIRGPTGPRECSSLPRFAPGFQVPTLGVGGIARLPPVCVFPAQAHLGWRAGRFPSRGMIGGTGVFRLLDSRFSGGWDTAVLSREGRLIIAPGTSAPDPRAPHSPLAG